MSNYYLSDDSYNSTLGFTIATVRTKNGYLAEIIIGGEIVWESEPFIPTSGQDGVELARKAAKETVVAAVERLFEGL